MSQPIDTAYVEVRPDVDKFGALLARRLTAALNQVQANVDRSLRQVGDRAGTAGGRAGAQFGDGFTREASTRAGRLGKVLTGALRGLTGLTKVTAGLAGIAAAVGGVSVALAGLASAAAAVVPVIGALAAAVASASGALLILPGALAAAVAVVATLKVGLSGLGDAMKAVGEGDADKLNEALKGLAPNAQAFVRQVDRLKPAFDKMKLRVQNALFKDTSGELRTMAANILPTVSAGLTGVAGVLNGQFRAGMQELSTANSRIQLGAIFDNAKRALGNLTVAVKPLIRALLDVSAVGSGVLADLTTNLGERIAGFAKRLSESAKDGSLEATIHRALQTLAQFGRVAADVFNIVKGIFTAAEASGAGAGLLGFLSRLSNLINSVAGQEALTELFRNLGTVGDALIPILLTVAQALGPISKAVGLLAIAFAPTINNLVEEFANALLNLVPAVLALKPVVAALGTALVPISAILRDLIVGAAPGLTAFIEGLVGGLEALVPIAPLVGQAFGQLLTAIAPLLPLLGQLAATVLFAIAGAIAEITAVLGPMVGLFAHGLTSALQVLMPVLLQAAANVLPILAQAGTQLAQAIAPLIPALVQIAVVVATQLIQYLPQFAALAEQLVPVIVELAGAIGQNLLMGLIAIAPHLPQLISSALELSLAWTDLIIAVLPIVPVLVRLSGILVTLALHSDVFQTAIGLLTVAIRVATGIVRIIAAVVRALSDPFGTASAAARRLGDAVRAGVNNAVAAVRSLGGQVRGALSNAGSILFQAGRNMVQGLINGLRSMIPSVGSVASSVAQTIRDRFPFSPAKAGPLSGQGNPYNSGRNVARMLAAGMAANRASVAAASTGLAAAVGGSLTPRLSAGSAAIGSLAALTAPTPRRTPTTAGPAPLDPRLLAGLIGAEVRRAVDGLEWRMTDIDRVVSRQVGYAANIATRTGAS